MKRSQFTLRGLVVVVVMLAVASALVIPAFVRARHYLVQGTCTSHLRSLWQVHLNHVALHGNPDPTLSQETGPAFWLKYQVYLGRGRTSEADIFTCPMSDDLANSGRCSYRGPARALRDIAPEDPIGADREGNHGPGEGGNVLMKTGDVGGYGETDAVWIRARTTTKE